MSELEKIIQIKVLLLKKMITEQSQKFSDSLQSIQRKFKEQDAKIKEVADSIPSVKDGVQGANGRDGKDGTDGKDGVNGRDGKNGLNGRDGRDGKNGIDGVGKQGPQGVKGDDGDSAYEVAVKNGYKGTEKEWLDSLKAELTMIPNQIAPGYTNPLPPRGATGEILSKKSSQDRDYKWIEGRDVYGTKEADDAFYNDRQILKDPTGFTNNHLIVVSYDSTTKKITLTGDFQAYCRGTLIPELVSGWQSPAIADEVPSGSYFLKYTPTGFVFDTSPFDFSCLQIAYVYYRANGVYLFTLRETHGFMDWQSHREFHETIGTYKVGGGALEGYTLQSTVETNRRPNTQATTIKDEDLITVNPTHNSKLYTIAYLQANGAITSDFNNTEIVRPQTGIPNYNSFIGGAWGQTPMNDGQNTRYMSMWQYAKPVGSDAGSVRYQYVWLQGQSVGDLASQEALTPQSLNMGALAAIVSELVFINQVIIRYRANPTNNWDIYSVKVLTGNKLVQTSSPSGNYLSVVTHDASLTGDGTVSNPLSVAFTPIVGMNATTMQEAIQELYNLLYPN